MTTSPVTAKGTENLVYIEGGERFFPTPVEIVPGPHGQAAILDELRMVRQLP